MVDAGDTYTTHDGRTLIVSAVADDVVTYLDVYEDGTKAKRRASEVQRDADEATGDVQRREG